MLASLLQNCGYVVDKCTVGIGITYTLVCSVVRGDMNYVCITTTYFAKMVRFITLNQFFNILSCAFRGFNGTHNGGKTVVSIGNTYTH